MRHHQIGRLASVVLLLATSGLLGGCGATDVPARAAESGVDGGDNVAIRAIVSGTRIKVALCRELSSETARVGDVWQGSLVEDVTTLNGDVVPAGSAVEGFIASATPARRGLQPMIELGVRCIQVHGQLACIVANADPVLGGRVRTPDRVMLARDLSAPAGSDDAAIADGYGAATARPGPADSTGNAPRGPDQPLVLAGGTVMSFRVSQTVALSQN